VYYPRLGRDDECGLQGVYRAKDPPKAVIKHSEELLYQAIFGLFAF
jgi:hypothetical protein